ncbi:MAG: hypothetical protein ISS25_01410 [Nanoarchaeota archaeon]|nr:hypothetical protein [DPANN group archaeon]MBL7116471.1 hypothetical protein [Nanoarchaeota archaeon]
MTDLTIEETDEAIEKLIELVTSDDNLQKVLKNVDGWKERWVTLESFVLEHLSDVGIDFLQYQSLWIRERFFYETQRKTGLDYGFCGYFVPTFRNRAESLLTDNLELDMDNKCTYNTLEPIMTTCTGTYRDICVHLHPKEKEKN